MEHSFPDWNFEEIFSQKKSIRPEDELVELLWKDGQVVLQSQTQRDPTQLHKQHRPETLMSTSQSSRVDDTFLEDQETVSWINYPPNDTLQNDFSSAFFSAIPDHGTAEDDQEEALKNETSFEPHTMPPPKFRESSSAMTGGPSRCGSNQLMQNDVINGTIVAATNTKEVPVGSLKKDNGEKEVLILSARGKTEDELSRDPNATSSSGGGSSGCSKETGNKRKLIMEADESVSQTYVKRNKSSQRSGSTRRSRAAEVHNLSERKRRDRINERMKALQELVPHCSKTDKASILDEAIDYLKSLQLQLQVMWMGSGVAAAPMMFQGLPPPYIAGMGMQIPSSLQHPMHLSRFSVLNRSTPPNPGLVCHNPVQAFNPVFSEQLRHIAGLPPMQVPSQTGLQNMNTLRFGSHTGQQSQPPVPATTDSHPSNP